MDLALLWYFVLCTSVVAYVILDGFDLGVGMLHLFTKKDEERRLMLNAIGPVWDGNEVWIVIVGGALLAGFTKAYAVLCSVFYTPLMIFLAGIIFRAVAIEFRSKLPQRSWRFTWDFIFSLGSFIITFVVSVLLGNLVEGIPIDSEGLYKGTFWDFFTPYTILMGITGVALFMMHGSIYLNMKIEGDFHRKTKEWTIKAIIFFAITYILLTMATLIYMPHMVSKMRDKPLLFLIALAAMLSIANIPRMIKKENTGWAFISSCFSLTFLFSLFGVGTFPVLIRSKINPAVNNITIENAACSEGTLKILLIIAGIGVPLVLAYGYWIYRIFRGKVKLTESSY